MPTAADSKPTVYLRADADEQIGYGHAGRMLAVRGELEELGAQTRWIGHRSTMLEEFTKSNAIPFDPLAGDGYAADETIAIAQGGVLITDNYDATAADLDRVAQSGIPHLVVDDFALLGEYNADVVVNPNIHGSGLNYTGRARVCAGADYVLVRREVRDARLHEGMPHRIHNAVICMGGGDHGGASAMAARALALEDDGTLNARVLLGNREHEIDVLKALLPLGNRARIDEPGEWTAALAWADFAVTGAGVLKYETAVTGIPSLIVAVVEHQREIAIDFAGMGTCEYVGMPDPQLPTRIAAAFARLTVDQDARNQMHRSGLDLIDGLGAERVAQMVIELGQAS